MNFVTLFNTLKGEVCQQSRACQATIEQHEETIKKVALVATVGLVCLNPLSFAFGAVAGLVLKDEIRTTAEKTDELFQKRPTVKNAALFCGSLAALTFLPISTIASLVVIGSGMAAAKMGHERLANL